MGRAASHDEQRTAWLQARGVKLIRVSVSEVTHAPDAVTEALIAACIAEIGPLHRPAAGPPPRSGEETEE